MGRFVSTKDTKGREGLLLSESGLPSGERFGVPTFVGISVLQFTLTPALSQGERGSVGLNL